jgi:hypothetical protein
LGTSLIRPGGNQQKSATIIFEANGTAHGIAGENILERLNKQELRELKSAVARNTRGDNELKLLEALSAF